MRERDIHRDSANEETGGRCPICSGFPCAKKKERFILASLAPRIETYVRFAFAFAVIVHLL